MQQATGVYHDLLCTPTLLGLAVLRVPCRRLASKDLHSVQAKSHQTQIVINFGKLCSWHVCPSAGHQMHWEYDNSVHSAT